MVVRRDGAHHASIAGLVLCTCEHCLAVSPYEDSYVAHEVWVNHHQPLRSCRSLSRTELEDVDDEDDDTTELEGVDDEVDDTKNELELDDESLLFDENVFTNLAFVNVAKLLNQGLFVTTNVYDSEKDPEKKGNSPSIAEIVVTIMAWSRRGTNVSNSALVDLFCLLGTLLNIPLPKTWKEVNSLLAKCHSPPDRVFMCMNGDCTGHCFVGSSLRESQCPVCGCYRFPRTNISSQFVIKAECVAHMIPISRQLEVMWSNPLFSQLLKAGFSRQNPSAEFMYDVKDAAGWSKWEQKIPDFFANFRNLVVMFCVDGVNLMKSGRWGKQKTSFVCVLEILNLPIEFRRRPEFQLTILIAIDEHK